MVKQKVACLCGNLKRNLLRRNNTTEDTIGSSPNSPLLSNHGDVETGESGGGSKNIFKKKSQKTSSNEQCSTNTPDEILCIFDKSLTIQHDPDEVTSLDSGSAGDVPPEIPPRIFYPPPKQAGTVSSNANICGASILLSPSKQELMHLQTIGVGADDRSTPSEHSTRSTASELFAAPAASISSHSSSNSSTDSFHCEGCHCSLHLSSNLQLNIAGKENNSMLEEYLKMNSHPVPKVSKSAFDGFSHHQDISEHSYSITNRFHHKDEIIMPPKITPSAILGSVGDSPSRRNQLSFSPILSEPGPILPPKSSEILSCKPCNCKNCTNAASSRSGSFTDSRCKRPVLISPKSSSKFSQRNMSIASFSIPSCPEDEEETTYENNKSVEHETAISAWPEVGEVLPTVSAYLQNQGKKRCGDRHVLDKKPKTPSSHRKSDQNSYLSDTETNVRRSGGESRSHGHVKTNSHGSPALQSAMADFRTPQGKHRECYVDLIKLELENNIPSIKN